MKNTVIVIMVVVAEFAGAVFVAPVLKPNNTAFVDGAWRIYYHQYSPE